MSTKRRVVGRTAARTDGAASKYVLIKIQRNHAGAMRWVRFRCYQRLASTNS